MPGYAIAGTERGDCPNGRCQVLVCAPDGLAVDNARSFGCDIQTTSCGNPLGVGRRAWCAADPTFLRESLGIHYRPPTQDSTPVVEQVINAVDAGVTESVPQAGVLTSITESLKNVFKGSSKDAPLQPTPSPTMVAPQVPGTTAQPTSPSPQIPEDSTSLLPWVVGGVLVVAVVGTGVWALGRRI